MPQVNAATLDEIMAIPPPKRARSTDDALGVLPAQPTVSLEEVMGIPPPRPGAVDPTDPRAPGMSPTAGMSQLDLLRAGWGKGIVDRARGIGQALGIVSEADIAESRARDAALMNTPAGALGEFGGATSLYALPFSGGIRSAEGANLLTRAAVGAGNIIGNGAVGAGVGAVQPYVGGDERLANIALGGGGAAALRAGGGTLRWIGRQIAPYTQAGAQRATGRIIDEFATNPDAVAGVPIVTSTGARPTIAQGTQDVGLARLEDASKQHPTLGSLFPEREIENNAARVGTLRGIAGTDIERAAAEQARRDAASDLYREAMARQVPVSYNMERLFARPDMQKAVKRAEEKAANRSETFGLSDEAITGRAAHDINLSMKDMLQEPRWKPGTDAADALNATRTQYLKEVEGRIPEYGSARTAYRDESKALNRMAVGQYLLDHGASRIEDLGGDVRLQPNALRAMLSDEKGLIAKATGRPDAGNRLADLFGKDTTIKQIVDEAATQRSVMGAGAGYGSPTAQRAAALGRLDDMAGASNSLEGILGVGGRIATGGWLSPSIRGQGAERVFRQLIPAQLDPALARAAQLAARRPIGGRLGQIVRQSLGSGIRYQSPQELDR